MLEFNVELQLESRSLELAQACAHEDVKKMKIPFGFDRCDGFHVLKLNSNFYGLCEAGLTQFQCIKAEIETRDLYQSKIDPYFFLS